MNCGRTRRLLPLFAGGDLPERKTRRVRKHLEACADCRRELEAYRKALGAVADAVRESPAGDWTPGEWRAVMDRVAKEKPEPRDRAAAAPAMTPKWVPAFASAATIVVAVAIGLLLKDSPIRTAGTQPGLVIGERTPQPRKSGEGLLGLTAPGMTTQPAASRREGPAAAALSSPAQDVISMTLVSPDTGLQVVWVFNRNFDWKGDSN
jgi:hypothetical protein